MNQSEDNVPLRMLRESLHNIPEFPLPPGFSLRWYQPGDQENWLRIQSLADRHNDITSELFQCQFGSDHGPPRQRQCYLLDAKGAAIGTGTAWFNENFERTRSGRIHWVAIVPEFQGRGAAKPLMSALCQRLRDLGHDRAYLSTSSARLPAIQLYRRFGFVPLIRSEADANAWRQIIC